jgi:D-3-phosphoglycerate dehydrogenase
MMKPTAYLINTARANLVDHDALIQALNDRRIGGAALDVFDDEPIDADSLLRRLDNVTLTPHLAGSTQEAFYRSPFLLVDVIRSQTSAAAS